MVPLLARGQGRADIAKHLGVSEETIKKHTSNILVKFDAVSQKDCYQDLKDYAEYYAQPNPAYKVYCHVSDLSVTFNSDTKRLRAEKKVSLECVHETIERDRFTAMPGSDPLLVNKCDGVDLSPIGTNMGMEIYEKVFDSPISIGQKTNYVLEREFDMSNSVFSDNYYSTWTMNPTGRLIYRIQFLGARRPKNLTYEVRANQVAIDDQSIVWTQDAYAAQLMTMQPKLQYSYIIKWTW